jgi:hypothetical protein
MRARVLARFPNLCNSEHDQTTKKAPSSYGRIISQAISFKVLSAAVVVLVAAAFMLSRGGRATDSPKAAEPQTAWQLNTPGSSSVPAATKSAPVVVAAVPAYMQSNAPKGAESIDPARTPQRNDVRPTPANNGTVPVSESKVTGAPPAPAINSASKMSLWPNPAYPTSSPETGVEPQRPGINQAMGTPSARTY